MIMSIPLMLLAVASIFVGYLGKDMIVGIGSAFWGNSLSILGSIGSGSKSVAFVDAEYLPYHIKIIPLIFSHLGIFFAYNIVSDEEHRRSILFHIDGEPGIVTRIHKFFSLRWNIDDLYNKFVTYEIMSFCHSIPFRTFDAG